MTDILHTVMFGERDRVRVTIDDDSHECPVEWNPTDCGMLTVRKNRDYSTLSFGDEADAAAQRMQFADEYSTDDEPMHAAMRYLNRQGYSVDYCSLTGYSQGDWMDVIIWTRDADYRKSLVDDVQMWFRGDIYALVHEQAVDYVRITNKDATSPDLTEWEPIDGLGGVYMNNLDDDSVTVEAHQHFQLPTPVST